MRNTRPSHHAELRGQASQCQCGGGSATEIACRRRRERAMWTGPGQRRPRRLSSADGATEPLGRPDQAARRRDDATQSPGHSIVRTHAALDTPRWTSGGRRLAVGRGSGAGHVLFGRVSCRRRPTAKKYDAAYRGRARRPADATVRRWRFVMAASQPTMALGTRQPNTHAICHFLGRPIQDPWRRPAPGAGGGQAHPHPHPIPIPSIPSPRPGLCRAGDKRTSRGPCDDPAWRVASRRLCRRRSLRRPRHRWPTRSAPPAQAGEQQAGEQQAAAATADRPTGSVPAAGRRRARRAARGQAQPEEASRESRARNGQRKREGEGKRKKEKGRWPARSGRHGQRRMAKFGSTRFSASTLSVAARARSRPGRPTRRRRPRPAPLGHASPGDVGRSRVVAPCPARASGPGLVGARRAASGRVAGAGG